MKRLFCSIVVAAALSAGLGCHSDAGKHGGSCTCPHTGVSACGCVHCKGGSEACTCPK